MLRKAKILSETDDERPPIWEAICSALGAEYRDGKEVIGASGLIHPVEAIGVDEVGKRLILFSAESNSRVAALLRGDVQSTTDLRVLVARPVAVDVSSAIRDAFFTKSGTINVQKILEYSAALKGGKKSQKQIDKLLREFAYHHLQSAKRSSLPVRTHLFNVIEQVTNLDWGNFSVSDPSNFVQTSAELLTRFSKIDNLAGDREQGICPFPTYELTDVDWDTFSTGKDEDRVVERLKEMEVFQFFFPPPERIILGMADRAVINEPDIQKGFEIARLQGHTPVPSELIPDARNLQDLLDGLKAQGYLAEGDFSLELAENGRVIRQNIRLRPSEGLIAKLSKVFSVKMDLNLKDIFGGR